MSEVGLLAAFGAGVLSFASPCVLPLVPAWVGVSLADGASSKSRTIGTALPFVVGMSTVFTLLGVAAGAASSVFAASEWVPRLGGVLIVAFGLALLGIGPRWLRSTYRVVQQLPDAGRVAPFTRSLVAGAAVGAAWTPCVGPLLGSALALAASQGGPGRGAVLLAVYSTGVGLPFLTTALILDSAPSVTRALAPHTVHLQRAAAVVLVTVGLAMATGLMDVLVQPVARLVGQS